MKDVAFSEENRPRRSEDGTDIFPVERISLSRSRMLSDSFYYVAHYSLTFGLKFDIMQRENI